MYKKLVRLVASAANYLALKHPRIEENCLACQPHDDPIYTTSCLVPLSVPMLNRHKQLYTYTHTSVVP